jgi:uncharacterized protein (TIGR02453 family)
VAFNGFKGWPAEAIEFYEGLEADNSKAYWQDNKAVYESAVLAPMEALLAELTPEFGGGRPAKVFRPYRDVRFSRDKSPYKTHMGAVLGKGGYLEFSSKGLGAGLGYYGMSSPQLARYRAAVADEASGGALAALAAEIRKQGIEVTGRDMLKTIPRGFDKEHPRAELLRCKGLIAWKSWPVAAWLGTKAAKAKVVDFLHAAQPLGEWLDAHVGPEES